MVGPAVAVVGSNARRSCAGASESHWVLWRLRCAPGFARSACSTSAALMAGLPVGRGVALVVATSVEPVPVGRRGHGPAEPGAAQLGDRCLRADPVGVVADTVQRPPWALSG